MGCFGEPYQLHVCPKCQEVWECPDDLAGVCRVEHVCSVTHPNDESGTRPGFTVGNKAVVPPFPNHNEAETLDLWEILVPVASNEGVPFSEDHHESFRRIVRALPGNGGTTSRPAGDGDWEDKETGERFVEKMIPIRFRACRADAERIAAHARKFYDQIEVWVYKISSGIDIIIAR